MNQARPPVAFPNQVTIGKSFGRSRVLALYSFEFRSRPGWMLLLIATFLLTVLAVAMLIAGGPVPWPWCVVWLGGILWAVVPFLFQLCKNVRVASERDRPGDTLESAFDERSMWLRNAGRYNRFEFENYVLAYTPGRFAYLRPRTTGEVAIVVPSELVPAPSARPTRFFETSA